MPPEPWPHAGGSGSSPAGLAGGPRAHFKTGAFDRSARTTRRDLASAWITVPQGALDRYGVEPDDLEGVAEFPRSVQGVRLALLFRHLANGRVKVSFRSVGDVDVARLAAQFGGGGHRKAAGASFDGSLPAVQAQVLAAARDFLNGG